MNAVTMICYNTTPAQLELTKYAVASVFAQDVPVHLWIVDNGSTPETFEWLRTLNAPDGCKLEIGRLPSNQSPLRIANLMMKTLFERGYTEILGVPNDVELPTNLFSEMLTWTHELVAANCDGVKPLSKMGDVHRIHGDIHMAVMMMRKSAYDKLMERDGFIFDEGFFLYASDCDFKLRAIDTGISTAQLDIQCWHYGSASHRLATAEVSREINAQADIDRNYFSAKWGFKIGSPEWDDRIRPINDERLVTILIHHCNIPIA